MTIGPAGLVAIMVALFSAGGVVTVVISAVIGRGGRRADVANTISEASDRLIGRFENEIKHMAAEGQRCEDANRELRALLYELLTIIEEASEVEGADPKRVREWKARALKARVKMQD